MKIKLEYRGNLISGNHRNKITRKGFVYPSTEYKQFQKDFMKKLKINILESVFSMGTFFVNKEKLFVRLTIFHNRMDIDGAMKCIFDTLQGIAYKNDNQIKKIEAEIVKHKTIVGFDMTIEEIKID